MRGKHSIQCQTCAKTDDKIELPRHLFPAQWKMQHCAFHEEIHVFEDWIFVRQSSLVLASEWTTNQKKV